MDEGLRFVDVNGARVGYETHGTGDIDIIYSSGLASHLDMLMEQPRYRRLLEELTRFGRVIRFDRRGSGISDPAPEDRPDSWELWVDDLTAVLDAAGSKHAAIFAANDAGAPAILFAATHPSRTQALILFNTSARFTAAPGYPEGNSPRVTALVMDAFRKNWGTEAAVAMLTPSLTSDEPFSRWYARFQRAAQSPTAMAESVLGILQMDARHVLSQVQCPTLVIHRRGYATIPKGQGEFLARHLPNARFLEIPGADAPLWAQDFDEAVVGIGELLGRSPHPHDDGRQFSTVLFTDIVSSTERAATEGDTAWHRIIDAHDDDARSTVARYSGKFIKSTGDGILAIFTSPSQAIAAARALHNEAHTIGLEIRIGLHAGPVILRHDGDVGGLAVHAAARVMSLAGPGETWASDAVTNLLTDPSVTLNDRGIQQLKGVPDSIALFTVTTS
jgi:class 3 adenylate cyclase/pimeloyl-ACP methyl ester carboxylesterase